MIKVLRTVHHTNQCRFPNNEKKNHRTYHTCEKSDEHHDTDHDSSKSFGDRRVRVLRQYKMKCILITDALLEGTLDQNKTEIESLRCCPLL